MNPSNDIPTELHTTRDLCTCATCGHQWTRGKDGSHSCAVQLKARVSELERERDKLADWKESAILVEEEFDAQELAKMLGGQLGESCRQVIQRRVPELLARVSELEREVELHESVLADKEREISELERDKVRLDKLESLVFTNREGERQLSVDFTLPDLRSAIDAAIDGAK